MRPKTLLVLALTVAVLGAFIWFVERDLPSTDERREREQKVLPVAAEEVVAVEIRRQGERTRIERVTGEGENPEADRDVTAWDEAAAWRLVAPLAARADGDAVEGLIDDLTGLEKVRTLEEVDPAGLGLDEPRATVVLVTEGGEWLLAIGAEVPASSKLIVGRGHEAGDEAFVVEDAFWSELEKPAGDWRSRQAFPAEREDIVEIAWGGDDGVLLQRDGDGFVVTRPFADEADDDAVEDFLAELTDLEIDEFVDSPEDLGSLGLEPPAVSFTVAVEGASSPVQVALGSPVTDGEEILYAEVDGQVIQTETDLSDRFYRAPEAWRSTEWTRFEVYQVDSVEVRRDGGGWVFERVDGDWRRDGEEISYTAASDLLYAVRDARAETVTDGNAYELPEEPLAEVVLTSDAGRETLVLYPRQGDFYPAQRDGREAILLLPLSVVDELLSKLDAAVAAEPVSPPEPPESTTD